MEKIKNTTFKEGDKVCDDWFPEWGIGVVKKVFKNSIHIKFPNYNTPYLTIFDKAHRIFLTKEEDGKSKI